jgi:pimeloyl-ACP methyl ester carboxylesterase
MPPLRTGVEVALRSVLAPGLLAARWVGQQRILGPDDPPSPRPSLSLAAKAVLDEIFFLTEVVSARFVAAADLGRLAEEVAAALAVFETRGWLASPERYHETPPVLVSPELRPARTVGRDYAHLVFASGYEPHPGEPGRERWIGYVPNRTAHAWVLRHPGRPRPWLVCIHGYRTGFPLADFVGFPAMWLHRELGLNVVLPVLPLHGPRTVGWRSGDGVVSGAYLDTVHVQAQAVWDVRRLLRWIRAEGGERVGVYGVSLGGQTAALLAALEPDLDCVIAGMPAADSVHLARWNVPWFVMTLAERLGIRWDHVEQLLRVTSPLAMLPQVARERRFLFAGLADRLVPRDHLHALWHHWERPSIGWYAGSHVSFLLEPAVRGFLRESLVTSGLVAD